MTDKELLEYAAKAAGVEYEKTPIGLYLGVEEDRNWNPLTDDGDAWRKLWRENPSSILRFKTVTKPINQHNAPKRIQLTATAQRTIT